MPRRRPEHRVAAAGLIAAGVRFAESLRTVGLQPDLGAVIGFIRTLELIDLTASDEVRSAGAAVFVKGPDDQRAYDAAFDRYWLRARHPGLPEVSRGSTEAGDAARPPTTGGPGTHAGGAQTGADDIGRSIDSHDHAEGPSLDAPAPVALLAYSAAEALRAKSFDRMSVEELGDAMRLVAELRPALPLRRTRRWDLHQHGALLAQRAMIRRSLATAGDPLAWLWRRRRSRPRPIVVICDISGSMEQHSRFVLRFTHALRGLEVRTEAFVFGTRLTRITTHLRHRDADHALHQVASAVHDWAGGTQIGAALGVFNRCWARRVLRSSTIVIIVSDGWDRGDAREVADEMQRLSRRCHRIVWLNPLAATSDYEPRTAGMAAAFPFIDEFLPIGNVGNLEDLGRILGRLSSRERRATGTAWTHGSRGRPIRARESRAALAQR